MDLSGIDLDGLAHDASALVIPEMVKGRTVHIDADFLAYQMSAEKADGTDTKTWEDMKHNCQVAATLLQNLAAAEFMHLHLTPSGSNKGDRYNLAIQKEYQGNRIDKPKPRYLNVMRDWMAGAFPATMHTECEADDGMASAQYQAIKDGNRAYSIIASKDKDLSMVPGLHLNWDTGEIVDTETDFGSVYLDSSKSTTKIKGFGHAFFWSQMLTGDGADNIQGLPKVPGSVLNVIKPTAPITKAMELLASGTGTETQRSKATATIAGRPAGSCGPVIAYEMIQRVTNSKQAFNFIKSMYESIGQTIGFKHWSTGENVPWQKVFVSEAQLLWMRRDKHNPLCVAHWWKEIL
jgi:hypothetical protein